MLRLGALRGRRRRKPRGNDGGYCERFWCFKGGRGASIYLDFFADRIGPPAGIVAGSGVAAVLFSWLIVGIHAWRVARESPIRALRYE